jgi:adenylosuccinate lyase
MALSIETIESLMALHRAIDKFNNENDKRKSCADCADLLHKAITIHFVTDPSHCLALTRSIEDALKKLIDAETTKLIEESRK